MKKYFLLALVSCSLLLSSIANSAVITANGVAINPLNLSEDYDSFYEFYDYRTSNSSSHTGFEKRDRVVIFLTQIKDEIALIMTAGGPGGFTGTLGAYINGSEGAISFLDDPDGTDTFDGSIINWAYSRNKSDGVIFSGIFSSNWSIDIGLQKRGGGLSGIDILTFDQNKQVSTAVALQGISKRHFSQIRIESVSSPAIAALFGLALVFLGLRAKQ